MTREEIIKEASKHIAKVPHPSDDKKIQIPIQDSDDPFGLFYIVTFEKKTYREISIKDGYKEWYRWEVYSIGK